MMCAVKHPQHPSTAVMAQKVFMLSSCTVQAFASGNKIVMSKLKGSIKIYNFNVGQINFAIPNEIMLHRGTEEGEGRSA